MPVYDRIGRGYAAKRVADPRLASAVRRAVGEARTVVNVGAGTGSYEPRDVAVVAVDPSPVMLSQRPAGAAPAVRAVAEALPFGDAAFDVGLAILTTHHWADAAQGLAELRRVSRRQVVLTWDPAVTAATFWFVRDYLPEAAAREAGLAALDTVVAGLPGCEVQAVPVPHDCSDGFFAAYWRRPWALLDPDVRASVSGIALCDPAAVARAVARLDADLSSGAWADRYAGLAGLQELDLGYRLVVTPTLG